MEKDNKDLEWFKKLSDEEHLPRGCKQGNKQELELQKKEIDMNTKKMVKLEKYAMDANQWIDEVAVLMQIDDRELAWKALRGVLHVIRDRLIPEEVFQLSAQFPMLIRGLFFEGYHYSNKPEKFDVEELKDRISEALSPVTDINPEVVFKSVLYVLYDHISEGELQDIYGNMPRDIQQLWDKSLENS